MKPWLPLLLVLAVGCSKIDMAKWNQQTGADVIEFVNRYRQAGTGEVETVLKDFLARGDEYDRLGWARYGAPGWIDEFRSNCEARLAVFHKVVGNIDAYQTHVRSAIAHLKRVHPDATYTEEDICGFVERLDEIHIKPQWRTELTNTTRSL